MNEAALQCHHILFLIKKRTVQGPGDVVAKKKKPALCFHLRSSCSVLRKFSTGQLYQNPPAPPGVVRKLIKMLISSQPKAKKLESLRIDPKNLYFSKNFPD